MAQDRLTRTAAGVGILALGAAAEFAAPAATPIETALDWTVGAALGGGGAWLLDRAPAAGRLAMLAAVTWFLGTLAGASTGAPAAVGSAGVLAYRGPLLHLLLSVPSGRLTGRPHARAGHRGLDRRAAPRRRRRARHGGERGDRRGRGRRAGQTVRRRPAASTSPPARSPPD